MTRAMELKPQGCLPWLLIGTGAKPGDAPSPQVSHEFDTLEACVQAVGGALQMTPLAALENNLELHVDRARKVLLCQIQLPQARRGRGRSRETDEPGVIENVDHL